MRARSSRAARRPGWRLLAPLLACAAACGVAAAPPLPSGAPDPALEVYGRLPGLENVALAPDGARIAAVRNTAGGRIIAIASLADGAGIAKLAIGDATLRHIQWVDDDTLLLATAVAAAPSGLIDMHRDWMLLQTYDVRERALRPLLRGESAGAAAGSAPRTATVAFGPIMVRRLDGRTVLFVHGYSAAERTLPGLFRIDLASGTETLAQQGSAATRSWLVDRRGTVVLEERYDEADQRWSLWLRRDGEWRAVGSGQDPYATKRIVGFAPDGNSALVRVLEGDRTVWRPLSLADGSWGAPLAGMTTWSEAVVDPATYTVIGGIPDGRDSYRFFAPGMQARWDSIRIGSNGARSRLISWSRDATKLVVLVEARGGPVFRLVDFERHDVRPIGPAYGELRRVYEVRRIAYRAADGLAIQAYLTLPDRQPAAQLPLVVLVHGGPAAHETGAFDWWAQALAAQGYAVLQANFRGSDADPALLAAGFGELGRKMQTDLSDGVRFLADAGTVDAARVCIVGASYGGYAALAGVALEPGVYRCAVAVAGLSDVRRFLAFVAQRDAPASQAALRFWQRFLGGAAGDEALLDAISPAAHAGAVAAPVLLMHGRDDMVVPYEQSAAMAAALRGAGKTVELVTLPREDHWLSRGDVRLEMLRRCVAFLRAHNPPDAAAPRAL